jgi:hypothetical protein
MNAQLLALLRQLNWRADKLLRQRGKFDTVIWLTLDARYRREWFEAKCRAAPSSVTDAELFDDLTADLKQDFAADGVTAFAIAYAANRVTQSKPIEQTFLLKPVTIRRPIIVIEAHSRTEHLRGERELLDTGLAALGPITTAADRRYSRLLAEGVHHGG